MRKRKTKSLSPCRLAICLGCITQLLLLIGVVTGTSITPFSVGNIIYSALTKPSKTPIPPIPSKPTALQLRSSSCASFLYFPFRLKPNFRNKIHFYKNYDVSYSQTHHFGEIPSTSTSLFQKSSPRRNQNAQPIKQPLKNDNSQQSSTGAGSSSNNNNENNNNIPVYPPIRINKVLKATHSRRQSDTLIQQGRLSVNGATVLPSNYDGNENNQKSNQTGEKSDGNEAGMGMKVIPYVDVVRLDGVVVEGWEELHGFLPPVGYEGDRVLGNGDDFTRGGEDKNKGGIGGGTHRRSQHTIIRNLDDTEHATNYKNSNKSQITNYQYIKYWKPRGVICTTDRSIRHNILEELEYDGYFPPHRVFPVGRLDKDTSGEILFEVVLDLLLIPFLILREYCDDHQGLILITSDGRLPNSVLRGQAKQPKTYQVKVDKKLSLDDLDHLRVRNLCSARLTAR